MLQEVATGGLVLLQEALFFYRSGFESLLRVEMVSCG